MCLYGCVTVYEWVRAREGETGVCFIHFSHLVSQSAPVLAFRGLAFTLLADLV